MCFMLNGVILCDKGAKGSVGAAVVGLAQGSFRTRVFGERYEHHTQVRYTQKERGSCSYLVATNFFILITCADFGWVPGVFLVLVLHVWYPT